MSEEQATPEVDMDEVKANLQQALAGEVETPEEGVVEPTEEYTEAEQRAMEMGWNPDPESLEDSDKEWIPADEFLRNQKWVNEIKELKRQLKKTKRITEAFKEQNQIAAQKGYEKAIADLKRAKIEAAENHDIAGMLAIDERIEEVENEQKQTEAAVAAAYTKEDWDTAYEDFLDDNPWYTTDVKMKALADKVGWEYAQSHQGASPEDVYSYVINTVKQEFQQAPAKPQKPAAVASPRRRSAATPTKAKHGISDIPEEHRHIAMTLIKTNQISEEEYLKQYFPEDYS